MTDTIQILSLLIGFFFANGVKKWNKLTNLIKKKRKSCKIINIK